MLNPTEDRKSKLQRSRWWPKQLPTVPPPALHEPAVTADSNR